MSNVVYNPTTARFETQLDPEDVERRVGAAISYIQDGMSERMAIFHAVADSNTAMQVEVQRQLNAILTP